MLDLLLPYIVSEIRTRSLDLDDAVGRMLVDQFPGPALGPGPTKPSELLETGRRRLPV